MATAKLKAVAAKTLGGICDELWQLREDKRALEAKVKVISGQMSDLEEEAFAMLEAQGLDSAKGKKGNISLGEPQLSFTFDGENGFEEFAKYVKKTGHYHLFFRRVSDLACREIFVKKGAIPGLKHFAKRKLSLTTVS
jgi:hypothetical protein